MVEELGMDGCKISEIESKRPVFSVFKLLAVKVKGCVVSLPSWSMQLY